MFAHAQALRAAAPRHTLRTGFMAVRQPAGVREIRAMLVPRTGERMHPLRDAERVLGNRAKRKGLAHRNAVSPARKKGKENVKNN